MPRHNQPRRVDYPDQEQFPGAHVVLPPEWLGKHLVARDAAVRSAQKHGSQQLTIAAIALAVLDEWGGIPGLEGDDPAQWDITQTPVPLLAWLEQVVYLDFAAAFRVPKALSAPSTNGAGATPTTSASTAGP